MKLLSWNVNGVRSALKKGLLDWMKASRADVICLQETKAHPGDVQHVDWPGSYTPFWNSAEKKGYSGTVVFAREAPLKVTDGIGAPAHDGEGRVITAEFADFFLVNVYWSLRHGEDAGQDPWDAWTLEWSTTSPPPAYNFETIPTVRSRRPLWDLKHPDDPDWRYE